MWDDEDECLLLNRLPICHDKAVPIALSVIRDKPRWFHEAVAAEIWVPILRENVRAGLGLLLRWASVLTPGASAPAHLYLAVAPAHALLSYSLHLDGDRHMAATHDAVREYLEREGRQPWPCSPRRPCSHSKSCQAPGSSSCAKPFAPLVWGCRCSPDSYWHGRVARTICP